MRRRQFLIGSGTALVGCKALSYRPQAPALDEHEMDTVAAIADTFLPGDDGTPGAHEANALATIVDPAYGLAPYLSELVGDLDQWCLATKLAVFTALGPADRERALEQRMGLHHKAVQSVYRPAYEALLALTKLAFFGGMQNSHGPSYAAFPGASRGYAPGSAAGAWASSGLPRALVNGPLATIEVAGNGNASRVRMAAFVIGESVRATLRLRAPAGAYHEIALAGRGDIHVDADALLSGPAAGSWRLEARGVTGTARLELWSLVLRTDLDDAA